jgi:hypothetical protein
VHAIGAREVRELDPGRLMLMLLWITAEASEPVIVPAHLLCPDRDHRWRHAIGSAERPQIGGGLLGRRRIEIALARHPGVAARLAFRGLFENHDFLPSS